MAIFDSFFKFMGRVLSNENFFAVLTITIMVLLAVVFVRFVLTRMNQQEDMTKESDFSKFKNQNKVMSAMKWLSLISMILCIIIVIPAGYAIFAFTYSFGGASGSLGFLGVILLSILFILCILPAAFLTLMKYSKSTKTFNVSKRLFQLTLAIQVILLFIALFFINPTTIMQA